MTVFPTASKENKSRTFDEVSGRSVCLLVSYGDQNSGEVSLVASPNINNPAKVLFNKISLFLNRPNGFGVNVPGVGGIVETVVGSVFSDVSDVSVFVTAAVVVIVVVVAAAAVVVMLSS